MKQKRPVLDAYTFENKKKLKHKTHCNTSATKKNFTSHDKPPLGSQFGFLEVNCSPYCKSKKGSLWDIHKGQISAEGLI
jgi:hypothetical protein